MNKNIIIGAVIIILIAIGAFVVASRKSETVALPEVQNDMTGGQAATSTDSTGDNAATSTSSVTSYTMADIASHNTVANCWVAVSGSVYNLTSWVDKHPGGKTSIVSLCGKDGTAAFANQHGGQDRAEQALASFRIGALAQ